MHGPKNKINVSVSTYAIKRTQTLQLSCYNINLCAVAILWK